MTKKINIVFHENSKEILNTAKRIFTILYRDYNNPLQKGLMIDTYFIQVKKTIDMQKYNDDFCIYLVDDNMVSSNFTNINDDNSLIVSYTKYIHNSDFNNNKLYINEQTENVELGIFTFLAKKLYSENKLTLFLSHTKRDDVGEKIAKDYHEYISSNTKLKSFIDVNDISHSTDIKEEIDESLVNTIFIAFESDKFSDSKWTQYELIESKKKNLPIIVINCIDKQVDRRFPYLGNCLVLNTSSIIDNIKEILIEAIRLKINNEKMSFYNNLYDYENTKFLNNVPELLNLLSIAEDISIYPDPPVSDVEEEVLSITGKKIYTPLTYICKDSISKTIGISVSEVNGNFDNDFENIHLHTAQEELAKYLLYTKNKIIYGGDIKYQGEFNFMEILADIGDSYNIKNSIINHSCYPLNRNINLDIKTKYKNIVEFKTFNELNIDNDEGVMPYNNLDCSIDFARNLSLMRELMARDSDARIMFGGKHFGYFGKYPGLLEEAYYTLKAGKPLYLIGGFGGVSQLIINLKNGGDIEELTYDWQYNHVENNTFRHLIDNGIEVAYEDIIQTIKEAKLNNLSDEDNKKLFYSTSIEEIIFYVLKGLNNA